MNEIRLPAAVLVPIYRDKSGKLILVLLRRTEGDVHGGQIAFPGGKKNRSDKSLEETALRETEEETGLKRSNIKIISRLANHFTQTSRFDITPFLAKIVRPQKWVLSEREVAEIIEVPLAEIADPKAHGEETKYFKHWPAPRKVPFYRVGKYQIWGATYRILKPLVSEILSGKWDL